MKIAERTFLVANIILVLIINECIRYINFNREYSKMELINSEFVELKNDIAKYSKIKNEYSIVYDENISLEEKVEKLSEEVDSLNDTIKDYNSKIQKLQKDISSFK